MNAITVRPAPKVDRRATQSFESVPAQREATKQSLRLTPKEIELLEYLWRGYASELGCKSLHGATENRLLRSPPKNTARPLVLAELERAGGRAPEGGVLRILVAEGCTRYETRQAIHWLVQGGAIERTPVDPVTLDKDGKLTKGAHESTGHELRLATPPAIRLALVRVPVPPEERQRRRWQSQDDALEAWHQTLVCGDSAEAPVMVELAESKLRRTVPATLAALRAIDPVHALVLRRVYGDVDPSARVGVFGRELAPIATLTRAVQGRRAEMAEGAATERLEGAKQAAVRQEFAWLERAIAADEAIAIASARLVLRSASLRTHPSRVACMERSRPKAKEAKDRREALLLAAPTRADHLRELVVRGQKDLAATLQARGEVEKTKPARFEAAGAEGQIRAGAICEIAASEVLRTVLDNAPQGKDAKARWGIARSAFVAKVRAEAEQLLIAASAAYRAARRGT
jgi:hypothetical protein